MLLECTNVVLSSRRENKDHPINYEMCVPRVIPTRNDTLCEHGGYQCNIGQSNKRHTVCTYQRLWLIDVRVFIRDRPTINGIQLTTSEYFTLKVLIRVSDELLHQMKILRDSFYISKTSGVRWLVKHVFHLHRSRYPPLFSVRMMQSACVFPTVDPVVMLSILGSPMRSFGIFISLSASMNGDHPPGLNVFLLLI